MKTRLVVTGILAAAFIISAGTEVFARNAGQGSGQRLRDGSCLTTSTVPTSTQTKILQQDRLRDGSCLTRTGTDGTTVQKQGRASGPGDGTGNTTRPLDGTGFGSPAVKK